MALKQLEYFDIEKTRTYAIIRCKFREFTPQIEDEAKAVFAYVFFQMKTDVRLELSQDMFIPTGMLLKILDIGRELMSENGRLLTIYNTPEALIRLLKRFDLDRIIETV